MKQKNKKSRQPEILQALLSNLASRFPTLKRDLVLANMEISPKDFVVKSLSSALLLSIIFSVLLYLMFTAVPISPVLLIPVIPLLFVSTFLYAMKLPEVRMMKRKRDLDMDIVFAGRQILIELRSGIPLFDSILSVTKGYGEVSKEFSKIVEKTTIGISVDIAMREISEKNPSKSFSRIVSQLANSVRSGSDVTVAFEGILDQVSREQEIELKAYGQKLNPLAMFYMIVGVILPSLGVVLTIIVLSFVSISIGTDILLLALVIQALLQYIFLTMVESARPRLYA